MPVPEQKGASMTRNSNSAGPQRRKREGAHRAPRGRSALTRTVAAGGAVACIGVAYEVATPTADALSILFNIGAGNTVRVNIVQGNVFDPQLGILGNVSNNTTSGSSGISQGSNGILAPIYSILDREIVLGGAVAGSNTTE